MEVEVEGIQSRRGLASPAHCVTPLIQMARHVEDNVLLKLENTQPAGSYAVRGLGRICQEAKSQGFQKVIGACDSSSGLALAYVAHELCLQANLVLPESTDSMICDILRQMGTKVHICGSSVNDAEEKALLMSQKSGISSIVPEVKNQLEGHPPCAVVAPGSIRPLVQGLYAGMEAVGWSDVPLVAMGGPSEDLPPGMIHVPVTDDDCISACIQFANDHRMLVEPSCGAALAAIYNGSLFHLQHLGQVRLNDPIVVIVGGGVGVGAELLQQWEEQKLGNAPN